MSSTLIFCVATVLLAWNVSAIPFCPRPRRVVMEDGTVQIIRIPCPGLPSIPPLPTRRPRPSPTPRPKGEFTIRTNALKIIKSNDGVFRGCADPLIYLIYARVIPGIRGSTITRNLGRIDYGEGRCSGRYIRKVGGFVRDRVPTDRVSVAAYVVIGIEEDNAGTSQVNSQIAKQLSTIANLLRKLEGTNISPLEARIALGIPSLIDNRLDIPDIKKPSDGFLGIGHDFVGFNALLSVGGSGYVGGQPTVCNRADFPICVKRDLYKGIVVGGKVDKNVWRADIHVDAV